MAPIQHNLEDSFAYTLGRAFRAMYAHFNRKFEDAGFDVTCEQFAVLHQLNIKDGQSQRELTEHTNKDKTTITRSIDGLEKRGLVRRVPGKTDGRQKMIFLTPKGKKFETRLFSLMDKATMSSQKQISKRDLELCKKVLNQIYFNVTDCS